MRALLKDRMRQGPLQSGIIEIVLDRPHRRSLPARGDVDSVLEVFSGASRGCIVLQRRVQNQVFQDREFLIDCHNKLPQILNREDKAEVADAMTMLKS